MSYQGVVINGAIVLHEEVHLPEGATGFTTIELKTNFVRSVRNGTIACGARLVHGGRTTQLWDATVTDPEGQTMALFRCTQLILR